jgi:hypothetical protein
MAVALINIEVYAATSAETFTRLRAERPRRNLKYEPLASIFRQIYHFARIVSLPGINQPRIHLLGVIDLAELQLYIRYDFSLKRFYAPAALDHKRC